MRVLAFDTAAGQCAACVLLDDGRVLHEVKPAQRGQAERLVPMLRDLVHLANLDFMDLDRIVVTTGPGSFTGVRVGLATARGLSLATNVPVVGIDSFTAFEAGLGEAERLRRVTVIESRRAELYWRAGANEVMASGAPHDIVAALDPGPWIIGGDGAGHLRDLREGLTIAAQLPGPEPQALARLGAVSNVESGFPQPVYVRSPDARPRAG